MKRRISFRAGASVLALIIMTALSLEAGYCAFSIRQQAERGTRRQETHARISALIEEQKRHGQELSASVKAAVDLVKELPDRWSDISDYSPAESLKLAAYQLQYLANRTPVLNTQDGIIRGPSGNETYYNLDMSWVVSRLQQAGIEGEYHVREDGVKMYGDYIMCAGDFSLRPFGTIVQTSLGEGIVCDTGMFIYFDPYHIDIAASW